MRSAAAAKARPARRSIDRAARRPFRQAVCSSAGKRNTSSGIASLPSSARRASASRTRKLVAEPVDRLHQPRELRFFFELRAQSPHVYVDRAFVAVEIEAPDRLQQS